MYIRVFRPESHEYKRLQLAAAMMTVKSPKHRTYYVGETYFDFGQDWKWTTILCKGGEWGDIQALSPREQEDIITAVNIETAIDAVFAGKWCSDK